MSERCPRCGAPITIKQIPVPKPIGAYGATLTYTYTPPTAPQALDAAERAVGQALGNQAKGGTMDRIALSEETNIALDALLAARAAAKESANGDS